MLTLLQIVSQYHLMDVPEKTNIQESVDLDIDHSDIDLDPQNTDFEDYLEKSEDIISNQENDPDTFDAQHEETGDVNVEDHPDENLNFADKASFREQSSYFQSVLAESSRFRNLPEPKGKKPVGRLQEIRDRPLPEMAENEDVELVTTPRSTPRGGGPGLLTRAKAMPSLKPEQPEDGLKSSRYAMYTELPPTGGQGQQQQQQQQGTPRGQQQPPSRLSLPPVAGGRVGDNSSKQDNILAYSRQGGDVAARLRLGGHNHGVPNNPSANMPLVPTGNTTPRLGGQPRGRADNPVIKNRDNSRISLDMQPLSSPRLNGK